MESLYNCHRPMRGDAEIDDFPYPVPYDDDDGMTHYNEGSDESERYLPSKLADVSKQPHNVPFPPIAQTAKNVGSIIKCSCCKKLAYFLLSTS